MPCGAKGLLVHGPANEVWTNLLKGEHDTTSTWMISATPGNDDGFLVARKQRSESERITMAKEWLCRVDDICRKQGAALFRPKKWLCTEGLLWCADDKRIATAFERITTASKRIATAIRGRVMLTMSASGLNMPNGAGGALMAQGMLGKDDGLPAARVRIENQEWHVNINKWARRRK